MRPAAWTRIRPEAHLKLRESGQSSLITGTSIAAFFKALAAPTAFLAGSAPAVLDRVKRVAHTVDATEKSRASIDPVMAGKCEGR